MPILQAGASQRPVSERGNPHRGNERPISGGEAERARIPKPHGGVLTPFPAGVSGNPHRGPDRHARVTQALLLRAYSEAQVRVVYSHAKSIVRTLVAWRILNRTSAGVSFQAESSRWGPPSGPSKG